jgi:sterol carrier protein 2
MTGIPIVNVNNNCSTGSTALYLARQAIESGAADCALASASSRCVPARSVRILQRPHRAVRGFDAGDRSTSSATAMPLALRYFGGAGKEHMANATAPRSRTFAKVRAKASRHAANNPLALFRKEVTVEAT